MNESDLANKFAQDLQEMQSGSLKDKTGLTRTEKRRIELARRLSQVDFSRNRAQKAPLRAHLLEVGKKTLPRRYHMKQIKDRLSPVWAGIGLTALGILLVVGLSLVLRQMQPVPVGTPRPTETQVNPTSLPSASLPAPNDTPSNSTPDVNAGNIVISFANLYLFDTTDYQKLADEFHRQNPTITVNIIPVDHAVQLNWGDQAKQADVVYLDGTNPAMLPGFLSLQPLLDATLDFKADDFWPGSFTSCEDEQGVPYGVPMTVMPEGIYYSPRTFDAARVAYPNPGWTWDDFRQTINQVGTNTNGNTIYGFVDGAGDSILALLIQKHFLANNGQLDPQTLADSLAWYVQLAKAQKLYPMRTAVFRGMRTFENTSSLLQNTQAAMWINTIATESFSGRGDQAVYVPYPVDTQDEHTTPVSAVCASISSGTKHPQAAWAWLQFISQHDLTGVVNPDTPGFLTTYLIPARQSLAQSSVFWSGLSDQDRSSMQYALEHAYYWPVSALSFSMASWNAELAIADAIQAGTDLVTALQNVAATTTAEAQATPTATAGPIVLNTAPIPTALPEGVTAINFNENSIMSMTYTYNGPEIKALVDYFQLAHPEIAVNLTGDVGRTADNDYLHALAESNDCFEAQGPGLTNSLDASDLLDLTPFLDTDPEMKADFYPAFLTPYQKDGKLLGLPADVFVQYVAYNADLLAKLGITLPKDGWTVDDLLAIAGQAANPGAATPIYGIGGGAQLFYTLNTPWYDTSVNPPKGTFSTSSMSSALTWLQGLYQKGTFYKATNKTYTDYLQAISQGQVALWITDGQTNYNTDPWEAQAHPIFDQNLPFTVGYAPLPLLSSGSAMSIPPGGVGYYISSHTTPAKAQACWSWISYLASMPSVFGGYTPRQSVLPKEDVGQDPARLAVVQAAIQEYNTAGYAGYDDPLLWGYNDILGQALMAVANGESVTAVLVKAQSDADAYLACITGKDLAGLNNAQVFTAVQGCYTAPTPQP